jgi:hypothetical protein
MIAAKHQRMSAVVLQLVRRQETGSALQNCDWQVA